MSSTQQPQQSAYTYTSSSAQSTRQLLEGNATSSEASNGDKASSNKSTGTSNSSLPSRPHEVTRKSSNYADAAAAAAASPSASASLKSGVVDGTTTSSTESKGSGGWKPSLDRNQSWNQEDWKRKVLMTGISDGDKGGAGFSQKS